MFMELQTRKPNRLKDYDYSQDGAYFITICTKDRKEILSEIQPTDVGNAVLGIPFVELTEYGKITEKIILQMQDFYDYMRIEKFVIMPNHIHLIITIGIDGVPRTAHPTISRFIGLMKRYINKEIGENIWQKSFHDHIIRDDIDYQNIWQYIDENPTKWTEDKYNTNI